MRTDEGAGPLSAPVLSPSRLGGSNPSRESTFRRVLSTATLGSLRGQLVGGLAHLSVLVIATVFAVLALLIGGMLVLLPTQGAFTAEVIWWGAPTSWWYYPELLVVQPWGVLQLPFLPTVAMVLVSAGAGLGATVAVRSVWRLRRTTTSRDLPASAAGVATGIAPGIASVATLGACCCTTCASLGGVALVAAASGSSVGALLQTEWYLPLFQVGLVYALLLGQEISLRRASPTCDVPVRVDVRFVVSSVLRVALILAGVTWSLAMFVEWGTEDPVTASAGTWYHWLFEHQLLSLTAIGLGMFPRAVDRFVQAFRSHPAWVALRGTLVVAGTTWGLWVPPVLVSAGIGGLLNEVFGAVGLPAAWGAIPPDVAYGPPLLFHWIFQHALVSGYAIAMGVAPEAALRPLRWSAGEARGRGGPALPGAEGTVTRPAETPPPMPEG